MECKNCNEEYDETMFPCCPYCLIENKKIIDENNIFEETIDFFMSERKGVSEHESSVEYLKDDARKDIVDEVGKINSYSRKPGKYLDVAVVDIPLLSSRSKNALRRSGIFYLSELKEYLMTRKLSDIKNLGKESEAEIVSAVIFMKSQEDILGFIKENDKEKITEKESLKRVEIKQAYCDNTYNLFVEYCYDNNLKYIDELEYFEYEKLSHVSGIGQRKINAIINHFYEVKDILDFLEDSLEGNIEAALFTEINDDLKQLSIESMAVLGINLRTLHLLEKHNITTIGDIYNISRVKLASMVGERNIEKFHGVQKYFKYSCIELLGKIFELLSDDDDYKIFLKRASGYTLQELADENGLTRERIRQIAKKFNNKISPFIEQIINVIIIQKQYIVVQELIDIYDNDDYDKILISSCKQNERLEYLDFADVFIPTRTDDKVTEDILMDIARDFVGEGLDLYDNIEELETLMNDTGFPYVECGEFINLIQKYGYKLYGDYAIKGSQSYGFLCARLIANEFPQGIKIYESEDLDRLRKMVLSQYGDLGLPENNRSLSTRLSEYLVLSGRGAVIAEENIHIELAVLDQIKEYMDETAETTIYYAELFAKFEGLLRMTSNVDNYNFLHGVLMLYYPDEYDYSSRDFVRKKRGKFVSKALNERIKNYIIDQNAPVHKNKLKGKFIGISDAMLFRVISEDRELFQWENNYYSCAHIIDIDEDTKQLLRKKLVELMHNNYGYCSDAMLYASVSTELYDFFMKNNISSAMNLFYLCTYLFEEEYDFRRPHIGAKGMLDDVSTKSVALHMLGDISEILYSRYSEIADNLMWSEVTKSLVFANIEKDYIRVSTDRYVLRENCKWNNNMIEQIEMVLIRYMKKDILPILNFTNWDELLNIGFEWNQFLLHSVVESMGINLRLIETRTTDRRYERGIIVYVNSDFKEYSDVVAHVLVENNMIKVSENSMLSFMVINGLTYKTIPKEIYNSKKIKYVDEKFVILR